VDLGPAIFGAALGFVIGDSSLEQRAISRRLTLRVRSDGNSSRCDKPGQGYAHASDRCEHPLGHGGLGPELSGPMSGPAKGAGGSCLRCLIMSLPESETPVQTHTTTTSTTGREREGIRRGSYELRSRSRGRVVFRTFLEPAFGVSGAPGEDSEGRSVMDGPYSATQTERGENTFNIFCGNCHTDGQFSGDPPPEDGQWAASALQPAPSPRPVSAVSENLDQGIKAGS